MNDRNRFLGFGSKPKPKPKVSSKPKPKPKPKLFIIKQFTVFYTLIINVDFCIKMRHFWHFLIKALDTISFCLVSNQKNPVKK